MSDEKTGFCNDCFSYGVFVRRDERPGRRIEALYHSGGQQGKCL